MTVLHTAVRKGDVSSVFDALKRSRDLNRWDRKGYTPLHWAIFTGNFEIAKLLLDAGADPSIRNKYGYIPLQMAVIMGWDHLANLLWDDSKVAVDREDLLCWAAAGGHTKTVVLLLEKGVSANLSPGSLPNMTPLHWAAQEGHDDVVLVLLEHGAYVDVEDENGFTALWTAAVSGHDRVVKLLVKAGANCSRRANSEDKATLLHSVCNWGRVNVVDILVKAGSDVNAKDAHGRTPLFCAVASGARKIVEILLNNGALRTPVDDGGLSPLDMLAKRRRGTPEIRKLLAR